jgi:hypothetical protein
MKAEDTHEVEVILHLRVPKTLPERNVERMRMALVTVAADMDHVIEAGVGGPTPLTHAGLLHLWNEVQLAAPIVHHMAPADAVWGGMTCTEAEALAGIFVAAGRQDVHDFIIDQHSNGDDDPGDLHYKEES